MLELLKTFHKIVSLSMLEAINGQSPFQDIKIITIRNLNGSAITYLMLLDILFGNAEVGKYRKILSW